MKILLGTFYHPGFGMGGAEKEFLSVARAMRDQFGEDVLCAVNDGDLLDSIKKEKLAYERIPYEKWQTPAMIRRLGRIVREWTPDVIHSHHRYFAFLADLFFRQKARLLYTEQVLRSDKALLFRYGHFATAVHESVRQKLIERFRVPAGRVITIPNAVEFEEPQPESLENLRIQYKKPGKITALCIGRLHVQKGHVYLVEAVSKLPRTYRDRLNLVFAGDGPLEAELKEACRRLKLEETITFAGYSRQIPALLALSEFMVLPSLWEGLPLSILETYAARKPVLATAIPGNRETVDHQKTGYLVKPRDSEDLAQGIIWFLDHQSEWAGMGEAGHHKWMSEFSLERIMQQYHDLYKRLVHES